jgi:hypothetical protein
VRQRMFILSGLGAVTALVAAGAAFGLGVTGVVTGTAGIGLSLPSGPSFNATLTGDDQTVTYSPTLGVVDARGTGGGWHLTASATALTSGTHTLPQRVTAVVQSCHTGSTCTLPTNGVTLPATIGTTGTDFYSSPTGFGLGKVDVVPTVTVDVPGNAYAGTYTSTVTFSATAGP